VRARVLQLFARLGLIRPEAAAEMRQWDLWRAESAGRPAAVRPADADDRLSHRPRIDQSQREHPAGQRRSSFGLCTMLQW